MTTDQPETLVDTFVRFGRIEDGFGCRVGVGLAPSGMTIASVSISSSLFGPMLVRLTGSRSR
jgi:hypothetical protein